MKKIIEEMVEALNQNREADPIKHDLPKTLERQNRRLLKLTSVQLEKCSSEELDSMEEEVKKCNTILSSMIENIDKHMQKPVSEKSLEAFKKVKGFLAKQQQAMRAIHEKITYVSDLKKPK